MNNVAGRVQMGRVRDCGVSGETSFVPPRAPSTPNLTEPNRCDTNRTAQHKRIAFGVREFRGPICRAITEQHVTGCSMAKNARLASTTIRTHECVSARPHVRPSKWPQLAQMAHKWYSNMCVGQRQCPAMLCLFGRCFLPRMSCSNAPLVCAHVVRGDGERCLVYRVLVVGYFSDVRWRQRRRRSDRRVVACQQMRRPEREQRTL